MKQLHVGDVLHVYIGALAGQGKPKLVVLVCCDAPVCCVLINTQNAADVLQSDELKLTQVLIDANRHAFLKYDSWIDAHEFFGIPEEMLVAAVNDGNHRGRVCPEILNELHRAIAIAPTIPARKKQRVLDALTAEIGSPPGK
ncbi:MAG TPA: hypothetical protein PJ986_10520 [Gammaproteobacteria bacterium]|nr:hypothetical protein [Gammaproteobacteria bacterium]